MTFAQPNSLAYQLCIHHGTVSADFLAQQNCKVSFRNATSAILRTSADLAASILANYPLPLNLTVIALLMLGFVLDLSFPSCATATISCAVVRLNADYVWHKWIKPAADHRPAGHGTIFVLANLIIWAIILCGTSKSSSTKPWRRSKYAAAAADHRYAKYRIDSDELEYDGDVNMEEQAKNMNDQAQDRDEDIAHKSHMKLVEIHNHQTHHHEYDSSAMTHKSSARPVPDPELHDDSSPLASVDAYDEDEKLYDMANPRNPDVEASSSSAAFHHDPSHAPAADSISPDFPLQNRDGCPPLEAISVSPHLCDHHQLRDVDEHENQLINKKCDEYINSVFDRIRKESISESF